MTTRDTEVTQKVMIDRSESRYSLVLESVHTGPEGPESHLYRIAHLTRAQAHALAGDHNNISWRKHEQSMPGIEKQRLFIERRNTRPAHSRAWILRAGTEHIAFISDGSVNALNHVCNPEFEPGQPNWGTRQIEDMDDAILDLEERLALARDQRASLAASILAEPLASAPAPDADTTPSL